MFEIFKIGLLDLLAWLGLNVNVESFPQTETKETSLTFKDSSVLRGCPSVQQPDYAKLALKSHTSVHLHSLKGRGM